MYQCTRDIIFLSLLLPVLSVNNNPGFLSKSYERIAEEELIYLSPSNLYRNFTDILGFYQSNEIVGEFCSRDLDSLKKALFLKEEWALRMLDASSKIPSGILEGNIIDLGMFDECIAIKKDINNVEIRGHHCSYSFDVGVIENFLIHPTFTICMPNSCTDNDTMILINDTISKIQALRDLQITVKSVTCKIKEEILWNTGLIISTSLFLVLVGFLSISSLCDILLSTIADSKSNYSSLHCLASFSLQRSIKGIFNTKIKDDNFSVIYGIRTLSMSWVIVGHLFVVQIKGALVNMLEIGKKLIPYEYIYIYTAPFSVDSFFAVSGLLMTYVFLKQIPRQKFFNVPMYYLHRYIRLTPSVIAIFLIKTYAFPYAGSGALWSFDNTGSCEGKWWHFLLYIQNFGRKNEECFQHLWYLAVDMQLFWVSPIILYPLYKKPKFGLAVLASFFIAFLITTGTIIGVNKYPMISSMKKKADGNETFYYVYEKAHTRSGPWLVGILFGYDLANRDGRRSKWFYSIGWLLTIGFFIFCLQGTKSLLNEGYEYDVVWETIYSTFSRPMWGFIVCWIIYISAHKCAGPIHAILSWKVFMPFSKVSYSMYIIHILVLDWLTFTARIPKYYSHFNFWYSFINTFVITFFLGICFSVLFESPVIVLEKLLFRKKRESEHNLKNNLKANDVESIDPSLQKTQIN